MELAMKYVLAIALMLSGCASLNNAGTVEYSVKPVIIGEQTVCCEVMVKNGKEYGALKAHVKKAGNDYEVTLEETGVAAFSGQKVVSDTVGSVLDKPLGLGLK